ncbi:MAG TPA: metallophosphoesterase [Actinocrinis sp.]|nr:metallophosphoesterase [Actinocrinis sp.]
MIVIAHLSDTHIDLDGGGDGHEATEGTLSIRRARAVMNYLENLPYDLDAVLVTGDIADHGAPAEYEQARKILASRHPTLIVPGNHDARAAFRRYLLQRPEPPADGPGNTGGLWTTAPINQVMRLEGCVIAACDSTIPGRDEGRLDAETLAWLEGTLAQTPQDVPALVAFHHPPAYLHVPYVDGIRQFDTEPLAALVQRYPNVVGFLCGHAHAAAATVFAGRPLRVAPGVVSTICLPWEQATSTAGHLRLEQPPAVAFHVLDDEGVLTTHYRCVIE